MVVCNDSMETDAEPCLWLFMPMDRRHPLSDAREVEEKNQQAAAAAAVFDGPGSQSTQTDTHT